MLFDWFKKTRDTRPTLEQAAVPHGQRLYVVGDIHGRSDLLEQIADAILHDLSSAPPEVEVKTILLGDYIDRGGDSFSVIDRLQKRDFPTPIECLRGNHEAMFLQFLEDPSSLREWRRNGGAETLHSYGVPVADVMRGVGYDKALVDIQQRMPPEHLIFLRLTKMHETVGDFFFCHAGVRPGVPLDAQTEDDLLWIRGEFLTHRGLFEKIIVHGHSPVSEPQMKPNRIGIDTKAYMSDVLTCLVLEERVKRLLQTTPASLRRASLA